jgi:ATP-binding cassette subfamily C (CFTR/MRP) protein 1
MKRQSGSVVFGGSTAYAAQAPWVQNCSLRDNILFGKDYDEARFEAVIQACALESDIEILPNGLETEIGEKGINLSGGQKARVCLARTVYFDADIVLLDDPLSAVDAGVSKHIVEQCLLSGPLADKTRVLVTHHLDVLPQADHIILLQNGRIVEQGTYDDLIETGEAFGQLIAEFGSLRKEAEEEEVAEALGEVEAAPAVEKKARAAVTPGAGLMQEEERNTGAVAGDVYGQYLKAMGSLWWGVILFGFYALSQAATVGNNIFLGLWSAQSIDGWNEGQYMGVYAALGAAGLLTFGASRSPCRAGLPFSRLTHQLSLPQGGTFLMYLRGITASEFLFNRALEGVMRSKVSWFDTTPCVRREQRDAPPDADVSHSPPFVRLGRITSRLSKDITTLDNQLPMQWNQLLTMAFSVLGTIALVFYTYPILGVCVLQFDPPGLRPSSLTHVSLLHRIFVPMGMLYWVVSTFYRAVCRLELRHRFA